MTSTAEPDRPPRSEGAAYMRWYRARNPSKRQRDIAGHRARSRALTRLAELHPEQMRRLYTEELSRAGLPARSIAS